MPFKNIKLNDGREIPQIAFGSWKIPREQTSGQVDQAIEVGFDHIDTAQTYANEEEVGQAIKESGLSRKELWITTKWSGTDGKGPTQSCNESLEKLGIDYIDLYLIHHPRLTNGDIPGKWREMESLVKDGKVKSIGVSNFQVDDLKVLLKHANIKPVVNQIKIEPYTIKATEPLIAYMQEHHIHIEGYSSLIPLTQYPGGSVNKVVDKIAARLGKKSEQVLLAWSKAKGSNDRLLSNHSHNAKEAESVRSIIITSSSRKERLQGYLQVGDIELSKDDVKAIDKAGRQSPSLAAWKKAGAVVAAVCVGSALWSLLTVMTGHSL